MKTRMSRQQGSLLIIAIFILVIGGAVVSALVQMTSVNTESTVENLDATKAFYLADGGMKWAVGAVKAVDCDLSALDSGDGTFVAGSGGGSSAAAAAESGDSANPTNPNTVGDTFSFDAVTAAEGTFTANVEMTDSSNFTFDASGSASGNSRSVEQIYTYEFLCGGAGGSAGAWKEKF